MSLPVSQQQKYFNTELKGLVQEKTTQDLSLDKRVERIKNRIATTCNTIQIQQLRTLCKRGGICQVRQCPYAHSLAEKIAANLVGNPKHQFTRTTHKQVTRPLIQTREPVKNDSISLVTTNPYTVIEDLTEIEDLPDDVPEEPNKYIPFLLFPPPSMKKLPQLPNGLEYCNYSSNHFDTERYLSRNLIEAIGLNPIENINATIPLELPTSEEENRPAADLDSDDEKKSPPASPAQSMPKSQPELTGPLPQLSEFFAGAQSTFLGGLEDELEPKSAREAVVTAEIPPRTQSAAPKPQHPSNRKIVWSNEKTEWCSYFFKPQGCRAGAHCTFAHNKEELRTARENKIRILFKQNPSGIILKR